MTSYRYRKSHCGDKTVVRSSYLHNGISYTGKMTSLYWIRAQGRRISASSQYPGQKKIVYQPQGGQGSGLEIFKYFMCSTSTILFFSMQSMHHLAPGHLQTQWWSSVHCSIRADSRLAPSQWETLLQSNAISHWLGSNLKSALYYVYRTGLNFTTCRAKSAPPSSSITSCQ